MPFYQQFREMAKHTNDTLCKFEQGLFYKEYYEKHQNDFTQIQEKDITFPNNEEFKKEIKIIIETIFKHEFWTNTEYPNKMINEYTKIIKRKIRFSNREKYFVTDNPGIDLFTFQFSETTNQQLPVNVFNYTCNLSKSIQHEYESFFFMKEMFSSGRNRISNLLDDTNIGDEYIFNTFRNHIYHDFYNNKIKELKYFRKEIQSNIIEPKTDNINEHSDEANIMFEDEDRIASEECKNGYYEDIHSDNANIPEILNKQEVWNKIIKTIDKKYQNIRLFTELTNRESFFNFVKNNISCEDLERKKKKKQNTDRYKKLNNEKVIEIRAKFIFLIIFNDIIKQIIEKQLKTDEAFKLIDDCAELDYVLRQNEFIETHNYTKREIIEMSIINPFVEKLRTNERIYNLFNSFIKKSSDIILNIF